MTENLKGKKLLILAGADVHNKLVRAAKELGVYTIVTDYLKPEASPAKLLADEHWEIDIKDTDTLAKKCQENNVDGVIAFCIDPAQIPYRQLCTVLNLPCYGTDEQFELFTNKRKFKDYCNSHNIGTIPEYTYEDYQTGNISYPVLVKPNITRGSRGQSICRNSHEMEDAIKKAIAESDDDKFLIEKYMGDAQDMEFSWLVINGEPYLIEIGDRTLGKEEDNLNRQHMMTILPSRHINEYYSDLHFRIRNMIKSTGMQFGAIFMQGFWLDGKEYMYDPGCRFPGADYEDILVKYIGFDSPKAFVKFALTGDVSSCFGNPEKVAFLKEGVGLCLSVSCRPGTICRINGIDELAVDPHIESTSRRYHCGETVPASGDVRQRVAEFMGYFPDRKSTSEFVKTVYEKLSYEDENGEDMIVSKVNPDIINN